MRQRILAILVLSLACGAWSFTVLAAQNPASRAELAEGPGKAVVLRVCGECHEPESRINGMRRSEQGWSEVVTEMSEQGMVATPEELETVRGYLNKHYGCTYTRPDGPCEAPPVTPAPSH